MDVLKSYLSYDETTNNYKCSALEGDLRNFIDEILANSVQDASQGELKEDPAHNAVTYKISGFCVRLYRTTKNLVIKGMSNALLMSRL